MSASEKRNETKSNLPLQVLSIDRTCFFFQLSTQRGDFLLFQFVAIVPALFTWVYPPIYHKDEVDGSDFFAVSVKLVCLAPSIKECENLFATKQMHATVAKTLITEATYNFSRRDGRTLCHQITDDTYAAHAVQHVHRVQKISFSTL